MMTMISRLEIITTSIRPSTTSMMVASLSLVGRGRAGHGDGVEDVLQRRLVAHRRADQVFQFHPEMEHVDALGQDQAEVERQLQPAAHENQVAERAESWGALFGMLGSDIGANSRDGQ